MTMSQTLVNDYGKSEQYSEGQVKTALSKLGYKQDLQEAAIAIFCDSDTAKAFGMNDAQLKRFQKFTPSTNMYSSGDSAGSFDGGGGGGD